MTAAAAHPLGCLANKVALVTGAGCVGPGCGNGRAIAWRFAEQGALVFGADCDTTRMDETAQRIAAIGGRFMGGACDVTSSPAVAQMVAECIAAYGRIDKLPMPRPRLE